MIRVLKFLVQIPPLLFAIVFGLQGVMWLIRPERSAGSWGYDLPDGGMGLSSMIGAMSGYGLVVAICLLTALIRRERFWYYPPIMIFFFLAVGRTVAGLVHGAPLLLDRVIVEFIITALLFLASRYAAEPQQRTVGDPN